jgi:MFS family permease
MMKADSPPMRTGAAVWALAVLFLANVFNQGDRMLFGVVVEPIRQELLLSDTQLSLASGLFFVLFNLIGGLFISRFIDRGNRVRILAAGVAGWSLATAATGYAQDFATLSLARIAVGIGEATAFPAAMSLIPDLFRLEARGRAVAIFQSSSFVGIVGGTIIAGVLAATMGWRTMFVVCGLAGVSVALLLVLTVPEPARVDRHHAASVPSYWPDLLASCRRVLELPGFPMLLLGFGMSSMMTYVLAAWGPAFLLRTHDVPLAEVGLVIGPAVGIGGIVGTIGSGFVADWLVRRRGRMADMLLVPLIGAPLSLPFMAGFIFAPTLAVAMGCAALMNVALSAALPPAMNFAINRTSPGDRGLTSTILLASMGLVGGALGPFVVGGLSDLLTPDLGADGLRYALSSMLVTPLLATLFLAAAYRRAAVSFPQV